MTSNNDRTVDLRTAGNESIRKHQRGKARFIGGTIAAVIILVVGVIVGLYALGVIGGGDIADETNTSISPGSANTESTLNMNDESTSISNIANDEEETVETTTETEVETETENTGTVDDTDDDTDDVEEETGLTSNKTANEYASSDAITLSSIDQDRMKSLACDFLTAFLTYDAISCATGNYVASWSSYVSNDALAGGSTLIYQHGLNSWNTAVSTYSELYSSVSSVEAKSIYVSHITSDEDAIAVRCVVVLDENQGDPGEMDWSVVQTNEMSYAVYFNANYQVVDVVRQHGRTIS